MSRLNNLWQAEGDLDARIVAAKEKAADIYYGRSTTYNDLILRIQYYLSTHYRIPIYSEYFQKRTVDELVFELEMIHLTETSGEEKMSAVMHDEEAKEELADELFGDWDMTPQAPPPSNKKDQWVDVSNKIDENEAMEKAKQFMETGEFITGDNT